MEEFARRAADRTLNPLSVLAELDGPFGLAILDPSNRSAWLAIDRMGIERITYATVSGGLVFGGSAVSVSGFPGIGKHVRPQALYDFLFMHMVPAPESIFDGIRKLPPASALQWRDGVSRVERYWEPSYAYAGPGSFDELRTALKDGLATAVRDSGVDERTGTFLSGGLDSSTVTGVLAKQSSAPTRTFSIGFGEAEFDELEYARIVSRHFSCKPFEYHVTPADIVESFPRIAASYDEPFGNSSAVPTLFCARLAAANGVTHLLAGDGGDEIFGGNERYAKQRMFGYYDRLPAWVQRASRALARNTSSESRISPLRKLKSYVEQASVPLPERFETWNFVYREGRRRLLDADFAAAIDLEGPLRLMREVWESAPSADVLERTLYYDWHFTLAYNDLRKVSTMCELAGVRVSYPMLHSAVVDVSTRVPPGLKMRNLELRTFFKAAMRDFLPPETLAKTKHGFGLPFGVWLKTDKMLGELIYSLLSDLKKRRIVSAQFLTELVAEHRAGHASYYGYAIWDLAMLEAWLARHIDRH